MNEKAPCSVYAVSSCLGITYEDASKLLASFGRKKHCGFNISPFKSQLKLETRPDLSCRSFDKVLPELTNGRYIIAISGHYFAVVNGEIKDNCDTKMKCRTKMVYEFRP